MEEPINAARVAAEEAFSARRPTTLNGAPLVTVRRRKRLTAPPSADGAVESERSGVRPPRVFRVPALPDAGASGDNPDAPHARPAGEPRMSTSDRATSTPAGRRIGHDKASRTIRHVVLSTPAGKPSRDIGTDPAEALKGPLASLDRTIELIRNAQAFSLVIESSPARARLAESIEEVRRQLKHRKSFLRSL